MSNKLLGVTKQDVFSKFSSFFSDFFLALTVSVDECHTQLLGNSLRIKKTNDPVLSFCYELFIIFVTQVFKYREISKLESMYNFRVIWRFLDTVTMVIPCCQFIPGETRLKAITQELKRQGLSTLVDISLSNSIRLTPMEVKKSITASVLRMLCSIKQKIKQNK